MGGLVVWCKMLLSPPQEKKRDISFGLPCLITLRGVSKWKFRPPSGLPPSLLLFPLCLNSVGRFHSSLLSSHCPPLPLLFGTWLDPGFIPESVRKAITTIAVQRVLLLFEAIRLLAVARTIFCLVRKDQGLGKHG